MTCMPKLITVAILLVALTASGMIAIVETREVPRRPGVVSTTLEAQVDAYLKPYLETKNFSGALLIARKGEVLLKKGYGLADQERQTTNTPQTKFHIASLSKTFTAAAIMMLAEQGLLRGQDPLFRTSTIFQNTSSSRSRPRRRRRSSRCSRIDRCASSRARSIAIATQTTTCWPTSLSNGPGCPTGRSSKSTSSLRSA